jgi:hypothetical protein
MPNLAPSASATGATMATAAGVKAPTVARKAVSANISTGMRSRFPCASRSAQAARRSIVPVTRTIEKRSVAPRRMKNRFAGNCAVTSATLRPASSTPTA